MLFNKVSWLYLFISCSLFQTSFAGPAKTEKLGYSHKIIVYACLESVELYTFGYTPTTEAYYESLCYYPPITGSVLNCAANKFKPYSKTFNKTIDSLIVNCREYGDRIFQHSELLTIYENATDFIHPIDPTANYTEVIFYQPVNITAEDIEPSYSYFKNIDYNFDAISTFAGIFYFYFIFIFILFGTSSLVKRLGWHRHFHNKYINWFRANISIPALFNGKHTEAPVYFKFISTLIPTRAESLVIFFFICLNVLLTSINYDLSSTEYAKSIQLIEAIADRTGLLSFGLIPLLIILAGRNNILTSLTGIPYQTFIVYHKWVARFMWVHAVIHSAAWTAYALYYKYLAYYYTYAYFRWGAAATILGGLILVQAFHGIRSMSYEVFLVVHIVLVIAFILACWYHCYSIGWLEWLYVSFAVWAFDRIVRIIRMSLFGIKKAEMKYLGDNTFRLKVGHNKWFAPFPGSYAFVYFMTPAQFWQSHPFTILQSVKEEDTLVFYIKVKEGLTKRLLKKAEAKEDKTLDMKVCIEGPYGHRAPIEKYDKSILIAGGNGIPGIFAHLIDISKREVSSKRVVKFLWIIKDSTSLLWFQDELREVNNVTNAELEIYITQSSGILAGNETSSFIENSSTSDEKKAGESFTVDQISGNKNEHKVDSIADSVGNLINLLTNVKFIYERPNLDELVRNELSEETGPSIAVMTCGPPKLCDSVRASVARYLEGSKGRVDYFEELQVW